MKTEESKPQIVNTNHEGELVAIFPPETGVLMIKRFYGHNLHPREWSLIETALIYFDNVEDDMTWDAIQIANTFDSEGLHEGAYVNAGIEWLRENATDLIAGENEDFKTRLHLAAADDIALFVSGVADTIIDYYEDDEPDLVTKFKIWIDKASAGLKPAEADHLTLASQQVIASGRFEKE